MKRSLHYLVFALSVVLLFGTVIPAQAGWVSIDKSGDTNLISKGMVKNSSPNRDEWSLMDVNSGTLTVVNDRNKMYTSGTTKEFCETISGMQQQMMSGMRGRGRPDMDKMMAGMDEMMKDLDPQQREMMEQMLNRAGSHRPGGMGKTKRPAPAISIDKAVGDVIAGFKTTHYRVSVGGRVAKEIWLTNDSAFMKDVKPYMNKFLQMSREMTRCTSMGRSMMGGFDVESSEAYQTLLGKGYPMREKDMRSGWLREVVKLEKRSIPDSELTLPKGYKKVSFSELMQSQMMNHRSR